MLCLAFPTVSRELHSGRVAMLLKAIVYQVIGLLVPVSFTPYGASTSGLSTQWSSWEPLTPKGHGNLILKRASRLDAFSGYHFRT